MAGLAPTTNGEEPGVPEQRSETAKVDLTRAWQLVRDELRDSVPDRTFELWLDPLRVAAARGATLYLTAPKRVITWAERRYAELVRSAVRHQVPGIDEVDFVRDVAAAREPAVEGDHRPGVNRGHVFERFVIGPGNRLAHAAALAVAEAPGESYNPLFLHGPPGLGKTHLLGAIANYIDAHNPDFAIHYTTAESFTNEFVAAVQTDDMETFKNRYRRPDVLLIDDVQFLEGKSRTCDEFFHTFNALYESGGQLVLSADRLPSELSLLAERLRDRFEWGLVAALERPDLRTRLTFLRRLSKESKLDDAEPAALATIAERATPNIRLLHGALTRVTAFSSLMASPITNRLVDQVLPGGRPLRPASQPTLDEIQDAVCDQLDVDRDEVLSTTRVADVVRARQIAMYLSRQLTDASLSTIARAFKRRDHTTVLHAIRKIKKQAFDDPSTLELITKVEEKVQPRS
jgi:chromosomal replication initiator protein